MNNFLDRFSVALVNTAQVKDIRDAGREQQTFTERMVMLTIQLREAAAFKDADLSLRMERLCIGFERQNYATSDDDRKRLDKQKAENGAAAQSLALVKNARRYREYIQELFPDGVSTLPEGEGYITHARRQIHQLGQYRKSLVTPQEKAFFEARQENLRAGAEAFKALQQAALAPLFRA
jgi:hypothetical protein